MDRKEVVCIDRENIRNRYARLLELIFVHGPGIRWQHTDGPQGQSMIE